VSRRRRPGEGCVSEYATAAGRRWLISYRVTDPLTGRSKAKLQRSFTTQRAAAAELRKRLVQVDAGTYAEPSKQALAAYLAEWIKGLRLAASTVASYRRNVEQHVVPRLGTVPLDRLTALQLTGLYRDLEATGRRDSRSGGLSARTVRYIHTILHGALRSAVLDGRLAVNPADRANPPSAKQAAAPEMHTWDDQELRTFLDWSSASGDELHAAWLLLAMTGVRRGELLGLRWGDVDLERGVVSVRRSLGVVRERGLGERLVVGSPKSGKARTIDVDPRTAAALRAHRAAVAGISLVLAKDDAPVIGNPDGTPRHPERFSREFARRLERCRREVGERGPSMIRLHDLRHTHATLMLRSGEHPKVVSERLGHSKVSITLDVYSHVSPTLQREAASRLAALVYGGQR